MEEIIGLLVVLAVGIFKAVNKKFEDAGKQPEVVVPHVEPVAPKPVEEQKPAFVRPAPVRPAAPKASTIEVVERQTKTKKPILIEEEEKGPKEKIDPKKLVLYSEIMTPKFNE